MPLRWPSTLSMRKRLATWRFRRDLLRAEAECCVPGVELLCGLEKADDLAVPRHTRAFRTRFGERPVALVLMIAWSRLAMARSGSFIAAIAASTAVSRSAFSLSARASAFSFWHAPSLRPVPRCESRNLLVCCGGALGGLLRVLLLVHRKLLNKYSD